MRRVVDYNEIPHHFAECVYEHCYNTRTRKMQDAPQVTSQMPNPAVNSPSKGYQPNSSNHFSVQHSVDGIEGVAELVLNYLQQPSYIDTERRVHCAELVKKLNSPEHKILEAIDHLVGEGLAYSTTDEFHYKSATNV